ncbi:MAG: TetR/AcrR family transcriptional regulator [Opitutales bacterium]
MPRTRSRPRTENNFLEAVLRLVAAEGCGALGVNAIAQQAGADKVLIYRYFGGLDGLLQRVAESRAWLPEPAELLNHFTGNEEGGRILRQVCNRLVQEIQADTATLQVLRWRKLHPDPLTRHVATAWKELWQTIPDALSNGLNGTDRNGWKQACSMASLAVEAELSGEPPDPDCFNYLAGHLACGKPANSIRAGEPSSVPEAGTLPTNLL